MKCLQCGGEMASRRENYLYRECGLPGITLQDVEVSRCPACGEYEVSIANIQGLHRLIAEAVAGKDSVLTAGEVRFLRKYVGFSGAGFADFIGVHAETVSRWETGRRPAPRAIERLLRHLATSGHRVASYAPTIAVGRKPQPLKTKLRELHGRWALPVVAG